MEDKELQELFAAKRTVEANRRRQEELAAMIGRRVTPASRHLWPLWAVSVAAGIAVVLITIPAIFRTEISEPQLIAQTPVVVMAEEPGSPLPAAKEALKARKSIESMEPIKTIEVIETIEADEEPSVPEEPAVEPKPEPQKPQRRVHRRTSTRMVSTGNAATTVKRDYRKAVADALCQEESNTITLHTIDLS